jgi:hypothetical protein
VKSPRIRRTQTGAAALAVIRSEFPSVTDVEREFPSLCFALATGVGKTRLMGAFISYLYLAHGIRNFFVLAPNLTIYSKLITDFTPNTLKYVFKGVEGFAIDPPAIITGDNYESQARTLYDRPDSIRTVPLGSRDLLRAAHAPASFVASRSRGGLRRCSATVTTNNQKGKPVGKLGNLRGFPVVWRHRSAAALPRCKPGKVGPGSGSGPGVLAGWVRGQRPRARTFLAGCR